MKFPSWLPVYGDKDFRGYCATEAQEQIAFFDYIKAVHPALAEVCIHPRNEGLRSYGQARWQKREGMTIGAADIIIPAAPSFVCELKRRDHTQSKWRDGQQDYLSAALLLGSFVCVALGFDAAILALTDWRTRL